MNYLPNDITTSAPAMPSNRYVLPSFEERTPYGYKRQDPYAKPGPGGIRCGGSAGCRYPRQASGTAERSRADSPARTERPAGRSGI